MAPAVIAGKAEAMQPVNHSASAPTRRCIASYKSAQQCYQDILAGLGQAGFGVVTSDRMIRDAEWRASTPLARCTCRYLIHVTHDRGITFVTHRIEPRYWFFTLCRNRDMAAKQAIFGTAIRQSLTRSGCYHADPDNRDQ